MQRSVLVLGLLASAVTLTLIAEGEARACGGCFQPPTQTASDITDERMLLSVSQTQTTLYDQIRYTGDPASFAWVLPIRGTVNVGLSADVLFDSVDTLTATTIVSPPSSCPPPPYCGEEGMGGASFAEAPPADASQDYLPVTDASGNVTETADQVRVDNLTALFTGIAGPNARMTRIRSDISHAAMTTDFALQASADQSEVSNVRNVTRSINEQCPVYGNSCSVVGYGTPDQSAASVANTPSSGSPKTGSPAGGTFACNTTGSSPLGGPVTGGAALAMLGLVFLRVHGCRGVAAAE